MATDPLDALHATPPAGFVAAREMVVRRLRDAGDAEAARAAAALRKPTPVVRALNQGARREPGAVDELLEATARLRRAQLGDPGAREDLRRGRLAREMAAPGVEAVAGAVPAREEIVRGERAAARLARQAREAREEAERAAAPAGHGRVGASRSTA